MEEKQEAVPRLEEAEATCDLKASPDLSDDEAAKLEKRVLRKIDVRLLPILGLLCKCLQLTSLSLAYKD